MSYVVAFLQLLISGVSNVFNFFINVGNVFTSTLDILPNDLSDALLICFGIIVSVRVLELLP